jgi:hypothetical protein
MRRRASAPKRVRGARSLETVIMTRAVSARRPAMRRRGRHAKGAALGQAMLFFGRASRSRFCLRRRAQGPCQRGGY